MNTGQIKSYQIKGYIAKGIEYKLGIHFKRRFKKWL
jgi:hypothetical protein